MEPTEASRPTRSGSQRRFPRALIWIAAAAVVLRIVLLISDRKSHDAGAGLVVWKPGETIAAAAARDRKPILYDFTAAWCPPCKRLDAEGWSDPELAREVGQRFAPARVVDRQREDGSNPAWIEDLHKRYAIGVFPTLVVADASGREIAKMEGYRDRKSLDEFLDGALQKAGQH
jgi:thiol:disulfide interchange protein